MSFLSRSIAQASSSRPSYTRSIVHTASRAQYISSPPRGSPSGLSQNTTTPPRSTLLTPEIITKTPLRSESDPDGWWKRSVTSGSRGEPGDQYSGRSIAVQGRRDLTTCIRMVNSLLQRTGVKRDVRQGEFYERPGLTRQRKSSERHRRRFQEMVSVVSARIGSRPSQSASLCTIKTDELMLTAGPRQGPVGTSHA